MASNKTGQSRPGKLERNIVAQKLSLIPPSGIRKFFDLLSSMEGVISLGVGEPDFITPWNICEAAIYSIEKGQTMYTSNQGMPELRQELSRHLEKLYGVHYNPATEILITVGVSEGLDLALRAVLDPGDEVIIPDPCYVAYSPVTVLAGGVPVLIPTSVENGFRLPAPSVKARITPKTKAIILGYPANPTGAVMSRKELSDIKELARLNNLTVISDEVYARLVYDGTHTCYPSLPGAKEHSVLLGGFSKAYAMTGWRIGYAAGPAEIIAAMTKIHQYTMLCASTMGQQAALEALKGSERDVKEMVADYNRRRRVMVKGLCSIGLDCHEPEGAFYAFPSIKATGLSSEEFAEELLKEEKVAVVPGTAFGACGEGHIRCCYATSLEEIHEAIRRMGRFVGKHSK
ncbi:MAG: aminotransferase class I/II-fold pyridoxal phosphate-dependent enzyme [Dehalococcoidia bacterium]|nr:aminotransferase class I/II-fold pyridoxal phosphate-dependent enzyme [Dehalococcoidia bacterium]MDZ4245767.1 aminotransferase class I/II-fold pyridoxal phosphate-dependent enzyme [Dehalococcoidia bacterium]